MAASPTTGRQFYRTISVISDRDPPAWSQKPTGEKGPQAAL